MGRRNHVRSSCDLRGGLPGRRFGASDGYRGAAYHLRLTGSRIAISEGKVFIYFYDPECMHCLDAGERMAHLNWGSTKFVGQPVVRPQFAPAFMERTGLKGATANDFPLLKKTFPYTSTPAGVAIVNGREVASLSRFDSPEPATTLKTLGFAQ